MALPPAKKERKEKFTLLSDRKGSLQRQQPVASLHRLSQIGAVMEDQNDFARACLLYVYGSMTVFFQFDGAAKR